MRGKVKTADTLKWLPRITPAYAGKRPFPHVRDWRTQDHPRLCGEKLLLYVPLPAGIGSPPPMRGKDIDSTIFSDYNRITPAYAGKSSWWCVP